MIREKTIKEKMRKLALFIKAECTTHPRCEGCVFHTNKKGCIIREDTPELWEITKEDVNDD